MAVATLGEPFDVETMSASDDVAARLIEAQLDAGEGPGWDAYRTRSPVVLGRIDSAARERWPFFSQETVGVPVHGIYSFPLSLGPLRIGAVDLYAESSDALTAGDLERAAALSKRTAAEVLELALRRHEGSVEGEGAFSRREVHQATGMVLAQLRISPAEALLRIRAVAFASGRSVRDTAADITARRLTLEP